jgi:hypothetical protein
MTDLLGIAAVETQVETQLPTQGNQQVAAVNERTTFHDLIDTMVNLRQYVAVCYYDDGTRSTLEFTDGTAAAGRANSLRTWLATLAAGGTGMTIYIPPGQYLVDTNPIEFDMTNVRVFAYGAVFKRDDNTDSTQVILLDGSGSCEIHGMTVDGNRAGNWAAATTQCDNIRAQTYDKVTLVDVRLVNVRTTGGGGSPRGVQFQKTVGHTVMRNCTIIDGAYSSIRNRVGIQEYYNVDCEIIEPNVNAAAKNTYTFSGTTLTATDGTHDLLVDDRVIFLSTTTLPTGIDNRTIYFVKTVPTADTFTIALTSGGTAISLSGGAGVHNCYKIDPTVNPDRFLAVDGGTIKSLKWYGGTWKSTLPVQTGGTVTPDDEDEDVVMTCSDDSPDALFTSTPDHGFSVGDQVYLRIAAAGTSLPGGFNHQDTYWVTEVPTLKTLKLSYLEHGANIAYQSAEVGTLHVNQLYTADGVLFDGLTIDCPNRNPNTGVIEGFIKTDNVWNIALKNINVPFAGHHAQQTALLIVDAPTLSPISDSATAGGRRVRISIDDCKCQQGGVKHLNGFIDSMVINNCEFGNERMTSSGVLDNILIRHCEVNNSILRLGGTGNYVDLSASWDNTFELFFNHCHFVARAGNRTIMAADLPRGGFYHCTKENLGSGEIYFQNTDVRRLQNNLAAPNDPLRLLWTSGVISASTFSNGHPVEGFTGLTGLPGQVIVSDDAGASGTKDNIWVWDDTNNEWVGDAIAYGSISCQAGSTGESTVDATPRKIAAWNNNGPSLGTTPDHTSDDITIDALADGTYEVSAHISFSGSVSKTYQLEIYKNTSPTGFAIDRQLGTGGDVGAVSLTGQVALVATDTISVYQSTSDSGTALTVTEAQLTVKRLGA